MRLQAQFERHAEAYEWSEAVAERSCGTPVSAWRSALIDKHVDFGFVHDQLKDSFSDTGRPPELLLRMLLIGYLYGTSSERRLVEELRMLTNSN